jgi:hypothetical protein
MPAEHAAEGIVGLAFEVALVGLVIAAFYLALQPRYLFLVRIRNGMSCFSKGKVTTAFLEEIDEVVREARITRGWIGGLRRGRQVVLAFSPDISRPCQQRLRNLWLLHR